MRPLLAAAALAVAVAGAAAEPVAPGADAGAPGLDASAGMDANPTDPCAEFSRPIERRKAFLKARREEQFARGGLPDPGRGILNATHVFCEAHPEDLDCALPPVAVMLSPDEMVWVPDASLEDYDPRVVEMRRELRACQARRR